MSRTVLDMSGQEAKTFFLKHASYCNFDLPPYFNFGGLLLDTSKEISLLQQTPWGKEVRNHNTSHVVVSNKDGRFAWRPFELSHPALYANLVHLITEPAAWQQLLDRFARFRRDPRIECWSIPREGDAGRKDKASQILTWWQGIEQRSLELSLDYDFVVHADVSNCYGSLYTHAIAWAVNGRAIAKRNHHSKGKKALLGNQIDSGIQDMRRGQTNGIPQGSTLMDFVAESVLGYVDYLISRRIHLAKENVHILRYRDDYRIFARDSKTAELALRSIVEILAMVGWSLNASKTVTSHMVVRDSIKRDKIAWLTRPQFTTNTQKQLLALHDFANAHPNSGSLMRGLTELHSRLPRVTLRDSEIAPMVAIVTDIAVNNPKVYALSTAVISRLISRLPRPRAVELLERVSNRFKMVPNTGYLDVWLQRIALPLGSTLESNERLCKAADGKEPNPWNSGWVKAKRLKSLVDNGRIVDAAVVKSLAVEISPQEVDVFFDY